MPRARRLRGLLIRVVLNRPLALLVGGVVAAPGIFLLAGDYVWESGMTDGIALVTLATGAAIAWAGLAGRTADWVEGKR